MKTLNPNKRSVLFALLVLSLGFSKSWFQTADNNVDGSRDLAASAPAPRPGTAPAQAGSQTAAQLALENARKKAHLAKKDEKPSDKDKKPDEKEKAKETGTPKEEVSTRKETLTNSEKDAKTTFISGGDIKKPYVFSVGEGDDRVEIVAKLETRKGRVVKVVNGKITEEDDKERTVAVFTTDCESCKIKDFDGFPEGMVDVQKMLELHVNAEKVALLKARKAERKRIADEEKAEKARLAKEKQKAEELAEALKNCTKMADGYDDNGDEKYIEISEEKNPDKYRVCMARNINALPLEERRDALSTYLNGLRENMVKSHNSADRYSLIKGLATTKRILGDSQLRRDVDKFKFGAERFNLILDDADKLADARSASEKLFYMRRIDSLAYEYSLTTQASRARGSDTAKFGDNEWLRIIRDTGRMAIERPEIVERQFFADETGSGSIFDGINGRRSDGILGHSSGLRSDRVQTDWLDIPGGSTRLGGRNGLDRLPIDRYSSMDPRRSTLSRRNSSIDPRFDRRDSLVFDNQIDYSTTRGGLRSRSRY